MMPSVAPLIRHNKNKKPSLDSHIAERQLLYSHLYEVNSIEYRRLFRQKRIYGSTMAFFEEKYIQDGLPAGMTSVEFVAFIVDELLGDDWRVDDQMKWPQLIELAFFEIIKKYSPKKKGKRK